jgi:hypothetical protein
MIINMYILQKMENIQIIMYIVSLQFNFFLTQIIINM